MPVNFTLFGRNIEFDDFRESYFRIRNSFDQTAKIGQQKYIRLYKSYGSIENVLDKSPADIYQLISEAGEKAVKLFIECGIMEIDLNHFLEDYYSYSNLLDDAFNKVEEQYDAIIEHSQEVDEYRRDRRLSRGRFVGGGFGVKGAVKGMAMAGTANMAAGTAHALFNGLAKAGSAVVDSAKKFSLYNDKDSQKLLFQNVYNAIFMMHYDVINVIKKHSRYGVFGGYLDSDVKKVDSILNNMKNATLDNDKKIDYYCQTINTYPYSERIYLSMLQDFNDKDGEIGVLAKHFGIDVSDYKVQKLKNFWDIEKSNAHCEQDALGLKKELIHLAEINGLNNDKIPSKLIEEIDFLINTFAKKERFVNDVWFNTIEEATTARKELEVAKNIIKTGNSKSIEGLGLILKELEAANFTTAVNNEQIKSLSEKYQKLEIRSRTVSGVVYNTKEEAATAIEGKKNQTKKTIRKANKFAGEIFSFIANFLIAYFYAFLLIIPFVQDSKHIPLIQSIVITIIALLPLPLVIIRSIIINKKEPDISEAIANANKIVLTLDLTGETIIAPTGIAWTVLFFGFAVPFERRDNKNGLIMFVLGSITLFISNFVYIFKYNKIFIKDILKKGFKPYCDSEKEKLAKLGF